MDEVQVWSEEVIIPTYGVGKPEKNPMFLEKEYTRGVVEWYIRILSSKRSMMKRKIRNTRLFSWKMSI